MAWSGFRNRKEGPQQGTLFDVRDVPAQPVDSPGMRKRGRREEMLAAMPSTKVFQSDPRHSEVKAKVEERGIPDWVSYPKSYVNNRATDSAGRGRRAEMSRELADRTTVEADTLRGLAQISEGQYTGLEGEPKPKFSPNTAAHYNERSNINGPVIAAPNRMKLGTLVHEIGHHESRYHQRNTGTEDRVERLTSGTHMQPAEEGRADAFALQHSADPRDYTYASNALGTPDEEKFIGAGSEYRREREAAGQPLREWEGGAAGPPRAAPLQAELFQTEPAATETADVQAYTRDEGREVLGWSPKPSLIGDPAATQKHAYRDPGSDDPYAMNPKFTGANYVSMLGEDVVPESRANDYPDRPQQTWKQRR